MRPSLSRIGPNSGTRRGRTRALRTGPYPAGGPVHAATAIAASHPAQHVGTLAPDCALKKGRCGTRQRDRRLARSVATMECKWAARRHIVGMEQTNYAVLALASGGFHVEVTKGRRISCPAITFASAADANKWIMQSKRLNNQSTARVIDGDMEASELGAAIDISRQRGEKWRMRGRPE
jgi:hypothetical protein